MGPCCPPGLHVVEVSEYSLGAARVVLGMAPMDSVLHYDAGDLTIDSKRSEAGDGCNGRFR